MLVRWGSSPRVEPAFELAALVLTIFRSDFESAHATARSSHAILVHASCTSTHR